MAQWRKVVVSGSSAVLNEISASGDIVPISDAGSSLGSTTREWNNLYIDGTANIDSLVADTADINGGTIDGITSLTAGGDLDIGAHDLRAATITADSLTATRIPFAGTDGVLSDDSDLVFATDTLTVTKIGAFQAAGAINFDNQNMTNVDIDSGAIDGTAIGAASHTTIKGTTIDATTDFTIDGLVITADTITNDATLTMDITNDMVIDVDGGNLDIKDAGAMLLNISATKISGSSTSTGSFGRLEGDGSSLTGVAQDINLLAAYGSATLHQTQDLFHLSDNGTEKSITFSNLEDSIFANVSSDIVIAAGGAATIGNDKIDSQHYAAGSVDDEHLSDGVATGLAGTGMTATSGVMNVIGTAGAVSVGADAVTLVAANTTLTSIINASFTKIGTAGAQEYITFGTSNEVNTFVNNTERHSVTATGVDITGNLTISGDLDVNGTTTTIDSTNVMVSESFTTHASGSTTAVDGGIGVQFRLNGDTRALGWDASGTRWSLQNDLSYTGSLISPDAYIATVETGTGDGDSQGDPTYGGATGHGNIYIDTDDSEIWIFA
jgi:hypothetical protein